MGQVHSQVERVAIDDVMANRSNIEAQHFVASELGELATRHVQTTAGFLALKRALCQLLARIGQEGRVERDFVLSHDSSGAPFVRSCVNAAPPPGLHVSITHTRDHAYGLAVCEECDHEW